MTDVKPLLFSLLLNRELLRFAKDWGTKQKRLLVLESFEAPWQRLGRSKVCSEKIFYIIVLNYNM